MPRIFSRTLLTTVFSTLGREPARLRKDRRGVTALEFAIAAPVLLTIGVGMLKFGVAMSHYIMVTNAAASGAVALGLARGSSTSYDSVTTAITRAAPSLIAANITKTVTVAGSTCTTNSGCAGLLAAGATASVQVSYPCDLSVLGINYKPSCTLSATSAQMVQ